MKKEKIGFLKKKALERILGKIKELDTHIDKIAKCNQTIDFENISFSDMSYEKELEIRKKLVKKYIEKLLNK